MDLTKLAKELKAQGVDTFEIKLTFHRDIQWGDKFDSKPDPAFDPWTEVKTDPDAPISPGMAAVMDAEMNPDKILEWSAPNSANSDTPLTGDDAPLTSGV